MTTLDQQAQQQETTAKVADLEHRRTLALATHLDDGGMIRPRTMGELIEFAKMISGSGMVPKDYINNPGAIIVAVQFGAELGLGPMASLQNIANINGRPCLWGDAGMAIVSTHRDFVDVIETQGEGWAKCVLKRKNRSPVEHTFTVDDAKKAGLWGKAGPWTNYPKRMLQMRARWFSMRDLFPDALRGITAAEEALDMPHVAAGPWPQPLVVEAGQAPVEAKPVDPKAVESSVKVVHAFESIGVSRATLIAKIGRDPAELDAQQLEQLRGIYNEVKANPKRKVEIFGQPPSAAADVNKRFAPQQEPASVPRQNEQPQSAAGF